MMGAGKSTVGKALARHLGWEFSDTDHIIEVTTGVSIPTIFEIEGEDGFRKRETQALFNFEGASGCILATGGGIVLSEENRKLLRRIGRVVYLRASARDLYERTKLDKNRPLLQDADPQTKIKNLLNMRKPLYEEVADLAVDTGRQPVQQIVQRIATCLRLTSNPAVSDHSTPI